MVLQMGTNEDASSSSSEMFSIGFTILIAAMLQDFLKLYNIKNQKFDSVQATNLLNEWKSNTVYSQIFTAIISNLCQFQPQKRLTDDELWSWISKYEREIKNKEDLLLKKLRLRSNRKQSRLGRISLLRNLRSTNLHSISHIHSLTNQWQSHTFLPTNTIFPFLPPNYQPPQEVLKKMPFPRVTIPAERYFLDEGQQHAQTTASTRMQSSPFQRNSESSEFIQQAILSHCLLMLLNGQAFDTQFNPQVVGRPLQQHQLPPEVRKAFGLEGQPMSRHYGQGQIPPNSKEQG